MLMALILGYLGRAHDALELAREGVPLNHFPRQLGHGNLGTTSRHRLTAPHLSCAQRRTATRGWPPTCRYGSMFWFSRKKFVGSYARFSSTKRSYCRSP